MKFLIGVSAGENLINLPELWRGWDWVFYPAQSPGVGIELVIISSQWEGFWVNWPIRGNDHQVMSITWLGSRGQVWIRYSTSLLCSPAPNCRPLDWEYIHSAYNQRGVSFSFQSYKYVWLWCPYRHRTDLETLFSTDWNSVQTPEPQAPVDGVRPVVPLPLQVLGLLNAGVTS